MLFNIRGTRPFADFFVVREGTIAVGEVSHGKPNRSCADSDIVAIDEAGLLLDFVAVDEHAVFAAHIQCEIRILVLVIDDLQVFSRDPLIEYLNQEGLVSSEHVSSLAKRIIVIFMRTIEDN